MLNHAPIEQFGLREIISQGKWELAYLKSKAVMDKDGNPSGYRADLVITRDVTQVVKGSGEIVKSPNVGEVITVNVNSPHVPEIDHMVMNVKLVNPVVHSVYATSQADSTYASINWSLSATDIQFPNTQPNQPPKGAK